MLFAIVGLLNQYYRMGFLKPGQHFLGGLFFLLVVSFNAALVPWLADKESLRLLHASVGVVSMCIIVSQVLSGIRIVKRDLLPLMTA